MAKCTRQHVSILNDLVLAEAKPVETPSYEVHFGGKAQEASICWNGNALFLTGNAHRYQRVYEATQSPRCRSQRRTLQETRTSLNRRQ